MNEVWSLDPIYRGYEDPAFAADLEALEALARDYNAFGEALDTMAPLQGLREGIRWQEELTRLGMKLLEYIELRQSTDTRDPRAGSYLGRVMQTLSTTAGTEAAWKAWAAALPELTELVAGDEDLGCYEFFFENLRRDSVHLLGRRGEEISARLAMSGGSAWAQMQGFLTSTVPVEYRGSTLSLSQVRNLAFDPDSAVRRDAYEAELACYDRIKDPVAYALNSIKLETLSDCALRGYDSPLNRTLEESRMRRSTLEAMLAAIEEYLPHFHRYLRTKAALLGHENGLPWYDLFAPMGAGGTRYTVEQARQILVDTFSGFDAELAELIRRAFDEGWIDFYPRDGKVGGAFCADVECIGQSRVLANFDGQFSDIDTLAHELGHAFHNECIRSHRPLNHHYSMSVAETASIFNECVLMASAIDAQQDPARKLALLESQLQDATQIICDIYSRYLFESMVFEKREREFMDSDALCALMLQAQQTAYGDGLDPNVRHRYMWVCKPHYYGPTFYNFPYAFGGLFSRGLYARYRQEGAGFVPRYKKLLYMTPVATAEDAAATAGIDLEDKAFWRSALDTIVTQIDQFCALAQTL